MKASKVVLLINAILFILFGTGFMFAPAALSQWITGAAPSTPSAMIDMRATYGGLALGIGILWWSCANNGSLRIGLFSAFLVLVSVAGGRIIGIFLDGSPNAFMFILLAAEIIFAILNFVLYRLEEK